MAATLRDKENARRLRAIWERYKHDTKMTQSDLAQLLGVSRSTVSQYMTAAISLSVDMTLKFATALKCSPTDIDPTLGALTTVPSSNRIRQVPVLVRLSGNAPGAHEVAEVMTDSPHRLFAVAVDVADYEPAYRPGATLFICPDVEPITGDHVLIELRTMPKVTINLLRRFVTIDHSAGKLVVTDLFGRDGETFELDQVVGCDPIVASHAPRANRPTRLHPRALG